MRGFSPLADRLHLLPGHVSAELVEAAVVFGTDLPFAQAATLLQLAYGTAISHDTVRRLTETAGHHAMQQEVALAAAIAQAARTPFAPPVPIPDAAPIPATTAVHLSLDGAMVSLCGGEWVEVRTLVIGELPGDPEAPAKATALSYTSALTTAAGFSRVITSELARRGLYAHPGPMVAVTDGAAWIQEVLDQHLPTSERVLDLMHAVEYLARAAHTAFGTGTEQTSEWIATQRTALRTGEVAAVLAALETLPPSRDRDTARGYLDARRAMLDYPRCDAQHWPVGSGTIESANKLVVEARLKRSGMHWARRHVSPVLALRTVRANGRWATAWPRIVQTWRDTVAREALNTRAARRAQTTTVACAAPAPPPPVIPAPVPARPPRPKTIVAGKPTADHPWNRGRPRPSCCPADPQ